VLGRVIEVVSGQRLDEFLATRILGPLGMTDTAFAAADSESGRLAALYVAGPGNKPVRDNELGAIGREPPGILMGGAGLVSTAADYHRFTQMLLDRPDSPAGELDGVTLLSPRTVAYMTRNHLPGGADLDTFGRPLFADAPLRGTGFGLGFAVLIDPVGPRTVSSEGEFSWGGAANTAFFVDNAEQLTACFYTQLLPTSAHRIRPQLRQMLYQALTG
jgi:CubicO group peptidase (beta-lactamase class C family)